MKIIFIQTGGTIDKEYPRTTKGYAFEIGEPAIERILDKINPIFEFEIVSLLKKDSLDITDEDRQKILQACKDVNGDRIIITHGTDTM
ncbi:MAG: asparaginase domain-containing protein, partial [bacterium]|nr:asparaginase domain-containing protein [bacterium]